MNRLSFTLSALLAPVLVLGTSSCSSMNQTRERMAEWKEKREEQKLAREVALAEKQIAEEAAATGQVAESKGAEDSIFLDYANPGGLLVGGVSSDGGAAGYGAAPALPGSELPVVLDLASAGEEGAPGGEPVFHADGAIVAGETTGLTSPVNADLVLAWASSISPLMGASLTEPLITAAMTAHVTPTESAVAAHSAATDLAPLASAFAGQPTRSRLSASTSELEHE